MPKWTSSGKWASLAKLISSAKLTSPSKLITIANMDLLRQLAYNPQIKGSNGSPRISRPLSQAYSKCSNHQESKCPQPPNALVNPPLGRNCRKFSGLLPYKTLVLGMKTPNPISMVYNCILGVLAPSLRIT